MDNNKIAVVIIAYEREASLRRLLDSVSKALYPEDTDIPLVISVDKGNNDAVRALAESFEWKHGEKRVIAHDTRLGLKAHVLKCGDLCRDYGSVILLEDDLFVSPGYYLYTAEALRSAGDDERVGGISLYDHLLNVHAREPFYAIDDGYDNYYMQFASSWGQAYNVRMWNGFRNWLSENDNKDISGTDMPKNVSGWSDKSWLKYNIRYLIDKDMFFLYPRVSLTTNFMDEGEHSDRTNTDLQVPLMCGKKTGYRFSSPDNSMAVYDAFFENLHLKKILAEALDKGEKEVTVDIYGTKETGKTEGRYLLTSKSLAKKVIKSYGRYLRPADANIIFDMRGNDIFLYDLHVQAKAPAVNEADRLLYDYRAIRAEEMLKILKYRLFSRKK
ncbi:MAG: glycosyltransferase [Lachnospiraceae bacterium]|nr:glycosyltransferase [Lachnospiraceae bacterium]